MRFKSLSRLKPENKTLAAISLLAFFIALAFSAYEPLNLLNLPGLLIVVLGTFSAAVVTYSYQEIKEAFLQGRMKVTLDKKEVTNEAHVILHFSQLWFRNQYSLIDRDLAKLDMPFLKRGLQLVRDRQSADEVLSVLNWQISQLNSQCKERVKLLESLANYAPAFGLIASVIALANLVQVMQEASMANAASLLVVAMLSTIYGLVLANLVFKPLARRVERNRIASIQHLSFLAEGVVMIQEKRTPAAIRDTLMLYIDSLQEQKLSRALKSEKLKDKTQQARAKLADKKARQKKKPLLVKFGLQGS